MVRKSIKKPFCEAIKNAYWSEMAKNAIESDYQISKMGRRDHFVKNKKLCINLKFRKMRSKVIFGHPKCSPRAILWRKVASWPITARKAIESDFWASKIANNFYDPAVILQWIWCPHCGYPILDFIFAFIHVPHRTYFNIIDLCHRCNFWIWFALSKVGWLCLHQVKDVYATILCYSFSLI